ncbi:MAG: SelB C-terminal domain-containing protein, partial [Actinomycetota bacterium]
RLVGRAHELTEKGAHLLYVGSAETPVKMKLLGTDRLASGESGFAQLHLRDPLPLQRGDRFVLRDAGRVLTFGGGTILDPGPRAARRRDQRRRALLERLSSADAAGSLRALVEAEGALDAADAWFRSGTDLLPPGVVAVGRLLVSEARLKELQAEVHAAVAEHHKHHPLERGLPRERARAATGLESDSFDALIDSMDEVVADGAVVRLAAFSVALSPAEQRGRDELVARIEAGGFAPPMTQELGADDDLLRALTDAGELVPIGDFFLTARQVAEARAVVRARIEADGPMTVAAIRDLLGTSRKYAVPLCEWLDQTGATRRRGDLRILGPNP